MTTAYETLLERTREVHLLESTAEILSWDQETMMPAGGVEHRAKQMALLAQLSHERASSDELGDLLATSADEAAGDDAIANVRELQRDYERRTRVPAALVAEMAETTSRAQHAWAEARAASDFAAFQPWLDKVLHLSRQRAECLGVPEGGELWDALAEDFEPGMRAASLERLFTPLREKLSTLVREIGSATPPSNRFNELTLPIEQQEAFVRSVAGSMGFDFERGRLDRSTHPFCGGSHYGDVRITTRFHDDNLGDALGSTMHEAGHGLYEQGLSADHLGTPLGSSVSLGIHESQSRLWENHVGRSAAFWRWARPQLASTFGAAVADFDEPELFRTANLVRPSLIRVEADEATYNLHVVVRFELERALIRGDLTTADLPAAWNEAYVDCLGVEVPDDRRGCLQDVHWSCGLVGYFPTYTLGTLYSAQFYAAAERAIPDLDGHIERGEFEPLRGWLLANVHCHGRRFSPDALCARATGSGLDADVFLSYLESKLRPVYGI